MPGFRCGDLGAGDGPADGEGAVVEVVEAQGGELSRRAPVSAARRTSNRFCSATWRRHDEAVAVSLATASSSPVDAADRRAASRSGGVVGGVRSDRAAHGADRMVVDDSFVVGPADRRAQHPERPARTEIVAPAASHRAIASRTPCGVRAVTRLVARASEVRRRAWERWLVHVDGFHG